MQSLPRAKYWSPGADGRVCCQLCPHRCRIAEGESGLCRARRAAGGALLAAGYGSLSSVANDPVEKKPLYHFLPGSSVLSAGGWGCNFHCRFCQNWTISQEGPPPDGGRVSPEALVEKALACGSRGVAYTYNEPLIAIEFVADCARAARAAGLKNVLVTNGFINPEPAAELLPWIDAANVDLKSIEDDFYRSQCDGRLRPVQEFILAAVRAGCHVEITNLIIPGLNDREELFEPLAEWIADSAGPFVPLHLSAYFPRYREHAPPTPDGLIAKARALCARRLAFVYAGNVNLPGASDTACPGCGETLIARSGYRVDVRLAPGGNCPRCGRRLEGVFDGP
jgi:pyruvate formate lyase activating enzyme